MYDIYILFAILNFILLSIFTYEDIKSRSINNILYYTSFLFLAIMLLYSLLFSNILMVVLFLIFGTLLFIYSKNTGNIGMGDVPIFLTTLLIIIIPFKVLLIIYFFIAFVSSIFVIPIVLYKRTFNYKQKIISIFLFIAVIISILVNKISLSLIFLFISSIYTLALLYKKTDIMYNESAKYMKPDNIVIGDLIINDLLSESQKKAISPKGRLTHVNKKLLKILDKNEKYPIYYNSFPMTVPIFIGFVIYILTMIL
jgi:hypothetical protein